MRLAGRRWHKLPEMPRYVALLRGINVGGRNMVAMADLRRVAASLGHTEVATYIQSGNVVFTSPDASVISLADALEQEIPAGSPCSLPWWCSPAQALPR